MVILQVSQALVDLENTVSTAVANMGESKALNSIVSQILTKTQTVAMLFGVSFYLIMLGFNYLKSGINKFTNPNESFFIDLNELTRSIGILFLIACYPLIMGAAGTFVNVAYSMTKMSGSDYQQMMTHCKAINQAEALKQADPAAAKAQENQAVCSKGLAGISSSNCQITDDEVNETSTSGTTPVPTESNGIFNIGKKIYNAIIDGINSLIAGLFLYIITCIKTIIFAITKIWIKIMYLTGPLALAFSILPFFRKQAEIWFGFYLNACFVFVTMNILDCIFYGYLANQVAQDQVSGTLGAATPNVAGNSIITYYLIMIIAYVSAFRITSYYVGKAEAGRAVGKAVGFAADMAMIAFTGGAGAAAGGGAATKIAESMKKGIKDNE